MNTKNRVRMDHTQEKGTRLAILSIYINILTALRSIAHDGPHNPLLLAPAAIGWFQLPGLLEHTPAVDGRQRPRRAPVSCSTASFTHPPTAVPPPQAQMVLPPTSAPLWAQALYVADVPAQELSRPVCYRATGWSYVASHTGCCCLVAGPAEPAVAPI